MEPEDQFNNAFYGFVEKVQNIVNNLLTSNQDDPDVTQATAKIWFLLEGLNSYLESSQESGFDFQIIDLALDMLAEEILKPRIVLVVPDAQGFLVKYKNVKDLLIKLAESYTEKSN